MYELDWFNEILSQSELKFLIALITKRSTESDYRRFSNLDVASDLGN
jgi:hypothetical protein